MYARESLSSSPPPPLASYPIYAGWLSRRKLKLSIDNKWCDPIEVAFVDYNISKTKKNGEDAIRTMKADVRRTNTITLCIDLLRVKIKDRRKYTINKWVKNVTDRHLMVRKLASGFCSFNFFNFFSFFYFGEECFQYSALMQGKLGEYWMMITCKIPL